MSGKICLASAAKHHWKYGAHPELGRIRNCQGCGMLQQRLPNGRWQQVGSTRWVPLMPSERESER